MLCNNKLKKRGSHIRNYATKKEESISWLLRKKGFQEQAWCFIMFGASPFTATPTNRTSDHTNWFGCVGISYDQTK